VMDSVEVREVLVQEPQATVAGAGLTEVAPVEQDGAMFRRLLAQNVKQNAVLTFAMPGRAASFGRKGVSIVAAILAAVMALVLTIVLIRRRSVRVVPVASDPTETVIREIAALDVEFERKAQPTDAERADFMSRRNALKARVATKT
jgi:hypothetical protein